jgi:hypothetical protein
VARLELWIYNRGGNGMGLLKIFFGIVLLYSFQVYAGPPLDAFAPPETNERKTKRSQKLDENDLVYTSTTDKEAVIGESRSVVIAPVVVARSLPGRKGKQLFKLIKGDKIGLLQLSKDQTWRAVYSFKASRKGWIPVSSIQPPEKPALKIESPKKETNLPPEQAAPGASAPASSPPTVDLSP